MKKYLFALIILFSTSCITQASPFITRWDLSVTGSGANQIQFECATLGIVNYTWETIPSGSTGSGTFNGSSATITGLPTNAMIRLVIDSTNFLAFKMNYSLDRNRLQDVEQWGSIVWNSMNAAFKGCSNLNITATDMPNLSNVSNMNSCFADCSSLNGPININNWDVSNVIDMIHTFNGATSFNQPIGNWDVGNVTNMSGMFVNASTFNLPIGNWDVGNVTNMSGMFGTAITFNQSIGNWDVSNVTNMQGTFLGATSFNQPIGNWDVSNVTNMGTTFNSAASFNQPIGNWDVSNVTNMYWMFRNATSINQPISNWDVSNVTTMWHMFYETSSFNQPISNWDVSNVFEMRNMFYKASSFNQPISNWDVSNVTNMSYMFYEASSFNQSIGNWTLNSNADLSNMFNNSGIDCNNYSQTLSGWANNPNGPSNRYLGAFGMKYIPNAVIDRNFLINTKGWTITGDTLSNNFCCVTTNTILNIPSCSNYTFNNQTLTTSGTYYDTITNASGCDSLITLNLTIGNATNATINATSCSNYFFDNQTLTTSGTYYDTLTNANGCDSLITLNLTIGNATNANINATSCSNYFFDNQTLTTSGTYYDTLTNTNGCDSLITLNLTINTTNNSIMQSGNILSANATGAIYQWLTCNPFAIISGANNQNYTASANGDYAVAITENGCTDTSVCIQVTGVGIDAIIDEQLITITPNPNQGIFIISHQNSFNKASVQIISPTGQEVFHQKEVTSKKLNINVSNLSNGVYFLVIRNQNQVYKVKLLKE